MSVAHRVDPDAQLLEQLAVGQAVAARVALDAVARADDDDRRILVRAWLGVPGGRERRIQRIAVPPRLDRCDAHSVAAVERVTERIAPLDQRGRAAGSRPSTQTPSAFRVAARLAWRTAVSSSATGSTQTATSTSRSPLASMRPSATASSTPWPMPSCAAPHVIVWWSIVEGGCLVHHQGRRPDGLVLLLRRADAHKHRGVPGSRVSEHAQSGCRGRAAAAGEHDVDVGAVRRAATPALADAPVELVEVHMLPSRSRTTRMASPECINSNPCSTSSSGRRCEIRRSSGRRPRRYRSNVNGKSRSGFDEP